MGMIKFTGGLFLSIVKACYANAMYWMGVNVGQVNIMMALTTLDAMWMNGWNCMHKSV